MTPLVLVVEDEAILRESIGTYLAHHGYGTALAESGEEGLRLAESAGPDVAVVDIRLPGLDGLEVLRRLRELSPGIEVVIMTAHASVSSAVEAIKRGAFDYLTKPLDLNELRIIVDKATSHLQMRRELDYLRSRSRTSPRASEILGESAPVRALREYIERVATLEPEGGGDAPTVLILGETGSGKEMVARAIHDLSPRSGGPFVELNCGAIPANLLEAELFGYEKGAYTDAKSAKPGLMEAADGGTLFLDEIGHMDLALQVKVLKAIEDKSVRRVGGLRSKSVNVRILAATNRDLEAAIADGEFRADLYYRIKVLTIDVPPLRARGDDVMLLARHFLAKTIRQYRLTPRELTPEGEAALCAYAWPGNVRELAHVMERAALLAPGQRIGPDELGVGTARASGTVAVEAGTGVRVDFSTGGIVLDDIERALIVEALGAAQWNRTRAAQLLGISAETLRYRMEKHQIKRAPAE